MAFTDSKGITYNDRRNELISIPKDYTGRFEIPYIIKDINPNAFANCKDLSSVCILHNIKKLASGTFKGCNNLRYVALGHKVEEIDTDVFDDCPLITKIFIEQGTIDSFSQMDGLRKYTDLIVDVPRDKFEPNFFEKETILSILKKNGIEYFYHITSKKNLESIKEHGGLLSRAKRYRLCIHADCGGNEISEELDMGNGLRWYVPLSFCPHPMFFGRKLQGEEYVVYKISLDVLEHALEQGGEYKDGLKFSDINAASPRAKVDVGVQGLTNVNIEATQMHLSYDDPLAPYRQAEILIKNSVPYKYIIEESNFEPYE